MKNVEINYCDRDGASNESEKDVLVIGSGGKGQAPSRSPRPEASAQPKKGNEIKKDELKENKEKTETNYDEKSRR